MNELKLALLKLPLVFDPVRLASEALALPCDAWMEHPNGLPGNSAVALISADGEDNNGFDGCMQPTRHLLQSPYLHQVVASFEEVIARSRLMRLAPRAEVPLHVDFNYHWYSRVRIHIPIVTNPDVTFHCGKESIHMAAGECWLFDSWRRHQVVNNGTADRIHLVIDLAGSSRFWQFVRGVQSAEQVEAPRHIPFQQDEQPTLRTENFPVAPVMSPGEMLALTRELIEDCSRHPVNNPSVLARYENLLLDLVHDWQEIWSTCGFGEKGIPQYRALIQRVAAQLDPDPRVLITRSNEVGINPILKQRILSAALRPMRVHAFSLGQ